jgi:5-methylcytosine-specific restriction endonuclease McrA
MDSKICIKCGICKPLTTEFYNLLSTGKWRGACKACMAANTKKHYISNPQKVIERVAKYKEQMERAGGCYSSDDVAEIRRRQNDMCPYCGSPLNQEGEVDHMQPVSRGGSSNPENLLIACRTCNRDKHSKTASEFLQWRKRLGLPIGNFLLS